MSKKCDGSVRFPSAFYTSLPHREVNYYSLSINEAQYCTRFCLLFLFTVVACRRLSSASGGASASEKDDMTGVFSEDDRQRWRDIVTHDSTFRTMIESAHTTEEVTNAVSQVSYRRSP